MSGFFMRIAVILAALVAGCTGGGSRNAAEIERREGAPGGGCGTCSAADGCVRLEDRALGSSSVIVGGVTLVLSWDKKPGENELIALTIEQANGLAAGDQISITIKSGGGCRTCMYPGQARCDTGVRQAISHVDFRLVQGSGGCVSDAKCDDGNPCTRDRCVSGECTREPVGDDEPCNGSGVCCSGVCTVPACSVDAQCADGNGCTEDRCSSPGTCAAICTHRTTREDCKPCVTAQDCGPPELACLGSPVCAAGVCEFPSAPDGTPCSANGGVCCGGTCAVECGAGCDGDGDCSSDDPCIAGTCENGTCRFAPRDDDTTCGKGGEICCGGSCVAPACTVESCTGDACGPGICQSPGTCAARCESAPAPGCQTCGVDADCSTQDPCEIGRCADGACVYGPADSGACACPAALGILGEWNVFACGSAAIHFTDIKGRAAIAGAAELNGVGLAKDDPAGPGEFAAVVGGVAALSNGEAAGSVAHGAASPEPESFTFLGGAFVEGSPLEFASRCEGLRRLSARLAAARPNAAVSFDPSSKILSIVGEHPAINVAQVWASDLNETGTFRATVPSGAILLVNVIFPGQSGGSVTLSGFGMFLEGTQERRVLLNLVEARDLRISSVSVLGSILAPHAHTVFNNGNLEGSLVTHDVEGGGEYHHYPFQGDGLCALGGAE